MVHAPFLAQDPSAAGGGNSGGGWNVVSEMVLSTALLYIISLSTVLFITKRKTRKNQVKPLACGPTEMYPYLIDVATGILPGSGTAADVWLKLRGELGTSRWYSLRLMHPSQPPAPALHFGQRSLFLMYTQNWLGEIEHLAVFNRGSKKTEGWQLSNITAYDLTRQRKWHFACYRWIAPSLWYLFQPSKKGPSWMRCFIRTFATGSGRYNIWYTALTGPAASQSAMTWMMNVTLCWCVLCNILLVSLVPFIIPWTDIGGAALVDVFGFTSLRHITLSKTLQINTELVLLGCIFNMSVFALNLIWEIIIRHTRRPCGQVRQDIQEFKVCCGSWKDEKTTQLANTQEKVQSLVAGTKSKAEHTAGVFKKELSPSSLKQRAEDFKESNFAQTVSRSATALKNAASSLVPKKKEKSPDVPIMIRLSKKNLKKSASALKQKAVTLDPKKTITEMIEANKNIPEKVSETAAKMSEKVQGFTVRTTEAVKEAITSLKDCLTPKKGHGTDASKTPSGMRPVKDATKAKPSQKASIDELEDKLNDWYISKFATPGLPSETLIQGENADGTKTGASSRTSKSTIVERIPFVFPSETEEHRTKASRVKLSRSLMKLVLRDDELKKIFSEIGNNSEKIEKAEKPKQYHEWDFYRKRSGKKGPKGAFELQITDSTHKVIDKDRRMKGAIGKLSKYAATRESKLSKQDASFWHLKRKAAPKRDIEQEKQTMVTFLKSLTQVAEDTSVGANVSISLPRKSIEKEHLENKHHHHHSKSEKEHTEHEKETVKHVDVTVPVAAVVEEAKKGSKGSIKSTTSKADVKKSILKSTSPDTAGAGSHVKSESKGSIKDGKKKDKEHKKDKKKKDSKGKDLKDSKTKTDKKEDDKKVEIKHSSKEDKKKKTSEKTLNKESKLNLKTTASLNVVRGETADDAQEKKSMSSFLLDKTSDRSQTEIVEKKTMSSFMLAKQPSKVASVLQKTSSKDSKKGGKDKDKKDMDKDKDKKGDGKDKDKDKKGKDKKDKDKKKDKKEPGKSTSKASAASKSKPISKTASKASAKSSGKDKDKSKSKASVAKSKSGTKKDDKKGKSKKKDPGKKNKSKNSKNSSNINYNRSPSAHCNGIGSPEQRSDASNTPDDRPQNVGKPTPLNDLDAPLTKMTSSMGNMQAIAEETVTHQQLEKSTANDLHTRPIKPKAKSTRDMSSKKIKERSKKVLVSCKPEGERTGFSESFDICPEPHVVNHDANKGKHRSHARHGQTDKRNGKKTPHKKGAKHGHKGITDAQGHHSKEVSRTENCHISSQMANGKSPNNKNYNRSRNNSHKGDNDTEDTKSSGSAGSVASAASGTSLHDFVYADIVRDMAVLGVEPRQPKLTRYVNSLNDSCTGLDNEVNREFVEALKDIDSDMALRIAAEVEEVNERRRMASKFASCTGLAVEKKKGKSKPKRQEEPPPAIKEHVSSDKVKPCKCCAFKSDAKPVKKEVHDVKSCSTIVADDNKHDDAPADKKPRPTEKPDKIDEDPEENKDHKKDAEVDQTNMSKSNNKKINTKTKRTSQDYQRQKRQRNVPKCKDVGSCSSFGKQKGNRQMRNSADVHPKETTKKQKTIKKKLGNMFETFRRKLSKTSRGESFQTQRSNDTPEIIEGGLVSTNCKSSTDHKINKSAKAKIQNKASVESIKAPTDEKNKQLSLIIQPNESYPNYVSDDVKERFQEFSAELARRLIHVEKEIKDGKSVLRKGLGEPLPSKPQFSSVVDDQCTSQSSKAEYANLHKKIDISKVTLQSTNENPGEFVMAEEKISEDARAELDQKCAPEHNRPKEDSREEPPLLTSTDAEQPSTEPGQKTDNLSSPDVEELRENTSPDDEIQDKSCGGVKVLTQRFSVYEPKQKSGLIPATDQVSDKRETIKTLASLYSKDETPQDYIESLYVKTAKAQKDDKTGCRTPSNSVDTGRGQAESFNTLKNKFMIEERATHGDQFRETGILPDATQKEKVPPSITKVANASKNDNHRGSELFENSSLMTAINDMMDIALSSISHSVSENRLLQMNTNAGTSSNQSTYHLEKSTEEMYENARGIIALTVCKIADEISNISQSGELKAMIKDACVQARESPSAPLSKSVMEAAQPSGRANSVDFSNVQFKQVKDMMGRAVSGVALAISSRRDSIPINQPLSTQVNAALNVTTRDLVALMLLTISNTLAEAEQSKGLRGTITYGDTSQPMSRYMKAAVGLAKYSLQREGDLIPSQVGWGNKNKQCVDIVFDESNESFRALKDVIGNFVNQRVQTIAENDDGKGTYRQSDSSARLSKHFRHELNEAAKDMITVLLLKTSDVMSNMERTGELESAITKTGPACPTTSGAKVLNKEAKDLARTTLVTIEDDLKRGENVQVSLDIIDSYLIEIDRQRFAKHIVDMTLNQVGKELQQAQDRENAMKPATKPVYKSVPSTSYAGPPAVSIVHLEPIDPVYGNVAQATKIDSLDTVRSTLKKLEESVKQTYGQLRDGGVTSSASKASKRIGALKDESYKKAKAIVESTLVKIQRCCHSDDDQPKELNESIRKVLCELRCLICTDVTSCGLESTSAKTPDCKAQPREQMPTRPIKQEIKQIRTSLAYIDAELDKARKLTDDLASAQDQMHNATKSTVDIIKRNLENIAEQLKNRNNNMAPLDDNELQIQSAIMSVQSSALCLCRFIWDDPLVTVDEFDANSPARYSKKGRALDLKCVNSLVSVVDLAIVAIKRIIKEVNSMDANQKETSIALRAAIKLAKTSIQDIEHALMLTKPPSVEKPSTLSAQVLSNLIAHAEVLQLTLKNAWDQFKCSTNGSSLAKKGSGSTVVHEAMAAILSSLDDVRKELIKNVGEQQTHSNSSLRQCTDVVRAVLENVNDTFSLRRDDDDDNSGDRRSHDASLLSAIDLASLSIDNVEMELFKFLTTPYSASHGHGVSLNAYHNPVVLKTSVSLLSTALDAFEQNENMTTKIGTCQLDAYGLFRTALIDVDRENNDQLASSNSLGARALTFDDRNLIKRVVNETVACLLNVGREIANKRHHNDKTLAFQSVLETHASLSAIARRVKQTRSSLLSVKSETKQGEPKRDKNTTQSDNAIKNFYACWTDSVNLTKSLLQSIELREDGDRILTTCALKDMPAEVMDSALNVLKLSLLSISKEIAVTQSCADKEGHEDHDLITFSPKRPRAERVSSREFTKCASSLLEFAILEVDNIIARNHDNQTLNTSTNAKPTNVSSYEELVSTDANRVQLSVARTLNTNNGNIHPVFVECAFGLVKNSLGATRRRKFKKSVCEVTKESPMHCAVESTESLPNLMEAVKQQISGMRNDSSGKAGCNIDSVVRNVASFIQQQCEFNSANVNSTADVLAMREALSVVKAAVEDINEDIPSTTGLWLGSGEIKKNSIERPLNTNATNGKPPSGRKRSTDHDLFMNRAVSLVQRSLKEIDSELIGKLGEKETGQQQQTTQRTLDDIVITDGDEPSGRPVLLEGAKSLVTCTMIELAKEGDKNIDVSLVESKTSAFGQRCGSRLLTKKCSACTVAAECLVRSSLLDVALSTIPVDGEADDQYDESNYSIVMHEWPHENVNSANTDQNYRFAQLTVNDGEYASRCVGANTLSMLKPEMTTSATETPHVTNASKVTQVRNDNRVSISTLHSDTTQRTSRNTASTQVTLKPKQSLGNKSRHQSSDVAPMIEEHTVSAQGLASTASAILKELVNDITNDANITIKVQSSDRGRKLVRRCLLKVDSVLQDALHNESNVIQVLKHKNIDDVARSLVKSICDDIGKSLHNVEKSEAECHTVLELPRFENQSRGHGSQTADHQDCPKPQESISFSTPTDSYSTTIHTADGFGVQSLGHRCENILENGGDIDQTTDADDKNTFSQNTMSNESYFSTSEQRYSLSVFDAGTAHPMYVIDEDVTTSEFSTTPSALIATVQDEACIGRGQANASLFYTPRGHPTRESQQSRPNSDTDRSPPDHGSDRDANGQTSVLPLAQNQPMAVGWVDYYQTTKKTADAPLTELSHQNSGGHPETFDSTRNNLHPYSTVVARSTPITDPSDTFGISRNHTDTGYTHRPFTQHLPRHQTVAMPLVGEFTDLITQYENTKPGLVSPVITEAFFGLRHESLYENGGVPKKSSSNTLTIASEDVSLQCLIKMITSGSASSNRSDIDKERAFKATVDSAHAQLERVEQDLKCEKDDLEILRRARSLVSQTLQQLEAEKAKGKRRNSLKSARDIGRTLNKEPGDVEEEESLTPVLNKASELDSLNVARRFVQASVNELKLIKNQTKKKGVRRLSLNRAKSLVRASLRELEEALTCSNVDTGQNRAKKITEKSGQRADSCEHAPRTAEQYLKNPPMINKREVLKTDIKAMASEIVRRSFQTETKQTSPTPVKGPKASDNKKTKRMVHPKIEEIRRNIFQREAANELPLCDLLPIDVAKLKSTSRCAVSNERETGNKKALASSSSTDSLPMSLIPVEDDTTTAIRKETLYLVGVSDPSCPQNPKESEIQSENDAASNASRVDEEPRFCQSIKPFRGSSHFVAHGATLSCDNEFFNSARESSLGIRLRLSSGTPESLCDASWMLVAQVECEVQGMLAKMFGCIAPSAVQRLPRLTNEQMQTFATNYPSTVSVVDERRQRRRVGNAAKANQEIQVGYANINQLNAMTSTSVHLVDVSTSTTLLAHLHVQSPRTATEAQNLNETTSVHGVDVSTSTTLLPVYVTNKSDDATSWNEPTGFGKPYQEATRVEVLQQSEAPPFVVVPDNSAARTSIGSSFVQHNLSHKSSLVSAVGTLYDEKVSLSPLSLPSPECGCKAIDRDTHDYIQQRTEAQMCLFENELDPPFGVNNPPQNDYLFITASPNTCSVVRDYAFKKTDDDTYDVVEPLAMMGANDGPSPRFPSCDTMTSVSSLNSKSVHNEDIHRWSAFPSQDDYTPRSHNQSYELVLNHSIKDDCENQHAYSSNNYIPVEHARVSHNEERNHALAILRDYSSDSEIDDVRSTSPQDGIDEFRPLLKIQTQIPSSPSAVEQEENETCPLLIDHTEPHTQHTTATNKTVDPDLLLLCYVNPPLAKQENAALADFYKPRNRNMNEIRRDRLAMEQCENEDEAVHCLSPSADSDKAETVRRTENETKSDVTLDTIGIVSGLAPSGRRPQVQGETPTCNQTNPPLEADIFYGISGSMSSNLSESSFGTRSNPPVCTLDNSPTQTWGQNQPSYNAGLPESVSYQDVNSACETNKHQDVNSACETNKQDTRSDKTLSDTSGQAKPAFRIKPTTAINPVAGDIVEATICEKSCPPGDDGYSCTIMGHHDDKQQQSESVSKGDAPPITVDDAIRNVCAHLMEHDDGSSLFLSPENCKSILSRTSDVTLQRDQTNMNVSSNAGKDEDHDAHATGSTQTQGETESKISEKPPSSLNTNCEENDQNIQTRSDVTGVSNVISAKKTNMTPPAISSSLETLPFNKKSSGIQPHESAGYRLERFRLRLQEFEMQCGWKPTIDAGNTVSKLFTAIALIDRIPNCGESAFGRLMKALDPIEPTKFSGDVRNSVIRFHAALNDLSGNCDPMKESSEILQMKVDSFYTLISQVSSLLEEDQRKQGGSTQSICCDRESVSATHFTFNTQQTSTISSKSHEGIKRLSRDRQTLDLKPKGKESTLFKELSMDSIEEVDEPNARDVLGHTIVGIGNALARRNTSGGVQTRPIILQKRESISIERFYSDLDTVVEDIQGESAEEAFYVDGRNEVTIIDMEHNQSRIAEEGPNKTGQQKGKQGFTEQWLSSLPRATSDPAKCKMNIVARPGNVPEAVKVSVRDRKLSASSDPSDSDQSQQKVKQVLQRGSKESLTRIRSTNRPEEESQQPNQKELSTLPAPLSNTNPDTEAWWFMTNSTAGTLQMMHTQLDGNNADRRLVTFKPRDASHWRTRPMTAPKLFSKDDEELSSRMLSAYARTSGSESSSNNIQPTGNIGSIPSSHLRELMPRESHCVDNTARREAIDEYRCKRKPSKATDSQTDVSDDDRSAKAPTDAGSKEAQENRASVTGKSTKTETDQSVSQKRAQTQSGKLSNVYSNTISTEPPKATGGNLTIPSVTISDQAVDVKMVESALSCPASSASTSCYATTDLDDDQPHSVTSFNHLNLSRDDSLPVIQKTTECKQQPRLQKTHHISIVQQAPPTINASCPHELTVDSPRSQHYRKESVQIDSSTNSSVSVFHGASPQTDTSTSVGSQTTTNLDEYQELSAPVGGTGIDKQAKGNPTSSGIKSGSLDTMNMNSSPSALLMELATHDKALEQKLTRFLNRYEHDLPDPFLECLTGYIKELLSEARVDRLQTMEKSLLSQALSSPFIQSVLTNALIAGQWDVVMNEKIQEKDLKEVVIKNEPPHDKNNSANLFPSNSADSQDLKSPGKLPYDKNNSANPLLSDSIESQELISTSVKYWQDKINKGAQSAINTTKAAIRYIAGDDEESEQVMSSEMMKVPSNLRITRDFRGTSCPPDLRMRYTENEQNIVRTHSWTGRNLPEPTTWNACEEHVNTQTREDGRSNPCTHSSLWFPEASNKSALRLTNSYSDQHFDENQNASPCTNANAIYREQDASGYSVLPHPTDQFLKDCSEVTFSQILDHYGFFATKEQCDRCMGDIYLFLKRAQNEIENYSEQYEKLQARAKECIKYKLSDFDIDVNTVEDTVRVLACVQTDLDDVKDMLLNWNSATHMPSHQPSADDTQKWFPKLPENDEVEREEYLTYIENIYNETSEKTWLPPWLAYCMFILLFLSGSISLIVVALFGMGMSPDMAYQWVISATICLTEHVLYFELLKVLLISFYAAFKRKFI